MPRIEWMPAHQAETSIGVVQIGDGSRLTREQWEMNRLVDEHAKVAAMAVRHVCPAARMIKEARAKVVVVAEWLARATAAANNGTEPPCRDSEPTKKAGGITGGKKRLEPIEAVARPPQLGGHELRSNGLGWECQQCRKQSACFAKFATEKCNGAAARLWARRAIALGRAGGSDGAGHLRAASGKLTWCVRCGAYAVRWAVGLAAPCKGRAFLPSQVRVRNRLCRGRHPRSNAVLAEPIVFETTLAQDEFLASQGQREEMSGMVAGLRPRTTAGYMRLSGGDEPAFGISSEQVAAEPESEEMRRQKRQRREEISQAYVKQWTTAIEERQQQEDQGHGGEVRVSEENDGVGGVRQQCRKRALSEEADDPWSTGHPYDRVKRAATNERSGCGEVAAAQQLITAAKDEDADRAQHTDEGFSLGAHMERERATSARTSRSELQQVSRRELLDSLRRRAREEAALAMAIAGDARFGEDTGHGPNSLEETARRSEEEIVDVVSIVAAAERGAKRKRGTHTRSLPAPGKDLGAASEEFSEAENRHAERKTFLMNLRVAAAGSAERAAVTARHEEMAERRRA